MAETIIFELGLRDNNAAKTLGQIKSELKDLKKELDGVQVGSEAFKILETKIKSASAQVREINKDLKGLSPEQIAKGFFSFGTALAGAFSTATGAIALFGKTSKEVEEAEKKSLAAINLLLGIEAVQQSVVNASKLIALGQSKLYTAQLYLENVATNGGVVAKTAAAGAMRVLNLVMAANPIGLVVTAVVGLVAALVIFSTTTDRAKSAQEAFNRALSDNAKFDKVFLENLKKNSETTLKDYDRRIELAKAQGKTDQEVNAITLKKLEYEKLLNTAALDKVKSAEEYNNLIQKGLDIQNEIDKIAGKDNVSKIEKEKELAAEALKAQEKSLEVERKRIELNTQINAANATSDKTALQEKIKGIEQLAEFDIQKIGLTEQEKKNIITAANIEIDVLKKEFNEAELQRLDEADIKYQESVQKRIDAARTELDARTELNVLNSTDEDSLLAAKIARIQQLSDFDVKYTDKTEAEKLVIKKKAEIEIQKLQKETTQQKLAGDAAILGSLANVAGAASGLAKKGSEEAKVLALFQVELAMAQALIKGVAAAQDVGFPANILAVATTVAEILGYAAQAKSILSGAKGLAMGGAYYESDGRGTYLRGPGTSKSDSINARLSDGEYVVNAKATKMFFPLIDWMNKLGNGFADGGIFSQPAVVTSTAIPQFDVGTEQLKRIEYLLELSLERAPIVKTYVLETDISSAQKQVGNIKNRARF